MDNHGQKEKDPAKKLYSVTSAKPQPAPAFFIAERA
jgi:hypothetical protein